MFRWFKLARRVSELEDIMAKLLRRMDDKELDWVELRARCKRLLDRTEKAATRAEAGVESSEPLEAHTPGEGTQGDNGHALTLTPAQSRLQQQIMRMRRT